MMFRAKTNDGGVVSFAAESPDVMNFAGGWAFGMTETEVEAQDAPKGSDFVIMLLQILVHKRG